MAKIVTPVVDDKAIASVKWTDEKARDRFFRDLGHTANNAGIWATLTHGGFAYVEACQKAQAKPDSEACFAAYVAGRTMPGGPGALSATSLPTYKSAIVGVVNAAASLPENYGSETLRDFIATECGKTSFSQRGGYIANILEAHPSKCGTAEEMKECSPESDRNVSQALASIVTALKNVGGNEKFASDIVAHGMSEPFKALLKAASELATTSAKAVPLPPKGNGKAKKGKSEASVTLLG